MNIIELLINNAKLYKITNIYDTIPLSYNIYMIDNFYKYDNIKDIKHFFNKMTSIIIDHKILIINTILPEQLMSYWYLRFFPDLYNNLKYKLKELSIIIDIAFINNFNITTIYKNKKYINKLDTSFYYNIDNINSILLNNNDPFINQISKQDITKLKKKIENCKHIKKRINMLQYNPQLYGYTVSIILNKKNSTN